MVILAYLLMILVNAQLGQDDSTYVEYYTPIVIEVDSSGNTTDTSISNIQQYVLLTDAEQCLISHCNEEIVACNHNTICLDAINRYKICYNSTTSFKKCKTPLLNTTLIPYTFELTDLFECYGLCAWDQVQPKQATITMISIILILVL